MFLKVSKRIDLKYSHHTQKKANCDVMEVLANMTVVIIL